MFLFDLRQRTAVPYAIAIQGLITSRREHIFREPTYLIEWKDNVNNDASFWYDESILIKARDAAAEAAKPVPPETAAPESAKSMLTIGIEVDEKKLKQAVDRIERATSRLKSKRKRNAKLSKASTKRKR